MKYIRVLLGSKSDADLLEESGFTKVLKKVVGDHFKVEYAIYSAHRNSRELAAFVEECMGQETTVFVGIAGLAAALPGAIAGHSEMEVPVIAVPLDEHGIDSCLYMPPGVPVLTAGVGKNGLKNAALAVCQIAALSDENVASNLVKHLRENTKQTELLLPAED